MTSPKAPQQLRSSSALLNKTTRQEGRARENTQDAHLSNLQVCISSIHHSPGQHHQYQHHHSTPPSTVKLNKSATTRAADPLFAFAIGTSAAFVRIRRNEQEKQPERAGEIGYGEIASLGTNRVRRWWAGEFSGV